MEVGGVATTTYGRTARTFLWSAGVICWIWRHCAITFWWEIMTCQTPTLSQSIHLPKKKFPQ